MADVGWGVPFQERKRWNIKSGIATHFSQMHDLFFPHKDDWILILAGRLEHVPSHLRELQHVFLQQRLLSISIKLLWCCSRLKAGCDDQVFPPSSQVSFEQTFPQLCEESSALLPKTLAYFVFFCRTAKVQQITYQQSYEEIPPFFHSLIHMGLTHGLYLNRQAVFLGCSKFLCHGKTWHISGPPEHLTPTVDRGWIPGMIRCTTIFFVVQSWHWAMTSSVVPGPKNRTESWGRFHFHESSLWDIFLGVVL